MVPNNPVLAPDARTIESISEVVVVFPFVPVTPTSCNASAGLPKKLAAAIAKAFRGSATCIQVAAPLQPAGAATALNIATAPRAAASFANKTPSVVTPDIATNTAPAFTLRESQVTW